MSENECDCAALAAAVLELASAVRDTPHVVHVEVPPLAVKLIPAPAPLVTVEAAPAAPAQVVVQEAPARRRTVQFTYDRAHHVTGAVVQEA